MLDNLPAEPTLPNSKVLRRQQGLMQPKIVIKQHRDGRWHLFIDVPGIALTESADGKTWWLADLQRSFPHQVFQCGVVRKSPTLRLSFKCVLTDGEVAKNITERKFQKQRQRVGPAIQIQRGTVNWMKCNDDPPLPAVEEVPSA